MNYFVFTFLMLLLSSVGAYGQEICDNAIDDDFDGLIDLNDDDCDCLSPIDSSSIPNPSFEGTDCCPSGFSQMNCATTWIQASDPTSDYLNLCDFSSYEIAGGLGPSLPLPGEGEGFVGFITIPDWNEYIGACLTDPLIAGDSYTLAFSIAWSRGDADLEVSLFGTPSCGDLPWVGLDCPVGIGGWNILASDLVIFPADNDWITVVLEFTPSEDIYAIAIGGPCDPPAPELPGYNLHYLDELVLVESDLYLDLTINGIGGWCSDDLLLTGYSDTVGGTWQWYKSNIALIGETTENLYPIPYGAGDFTLVYTLGSQCQKAFYSSPELIFDSEFDFTFDESCSPVNVNFDNPIPGAEDGIWLWDFGDGAESSELNPEHFYAEGGIYDVSLISFNVDDASCNDTVITAILITPTPTAVIGFDAPALYTWAGHEVVCMNNEVNFHDLSFVPEPSDIVEWTWYFDDGTTSDEQNPIHLFEDYGIFDISLVVTTESGCTDSTFYENLYVTAIFPEFTTENECVFEEVLFDNTSTLILPEIFDEWQWNYGDGTTATTEDGANTYTSPGNYTVQLIATTVEGCMDTMETIVTVYPLPESAFAFAVDGISSLDGGTGGCFTSEVEFSSLATVDDPSIIDSWLWNFGDGGTSVLENPTHLYASEGTYTIALTVVTNHGCQHSFSMDILMTNGLSFLSSDTSICQNGTVTLLAMSSDGSFHTYDWSIPGSDDNAEQVVDGLTADLWVYVNATNAAGCISPMDSVLITVLDPITLVISQFDTVCIGDLTSPEVTASGGNGEYTYEWTVGGALFPDNAPVINQNPFFSSEYCVTVSDACETDPVTVCTETYVPEYVSFTADTTEGCEPTEITFIDLTGPDSDVNESTWFINDETLYGDTVSYVFEEAGDYTVALDVLSPEGCITSLSEFAYITIHPLPNPAFYVTPNPTTFFNTVVESVNINPEFGSSFEWLIPGGSPTYSTSDSLVEIRYPELISGEYEVTLVEKTQYGCVNSISQIIIINNDQIIYAPNTFTPDGDSFNETWGVFIEGIDVYDFHLTLFNRWGELIWESYNTAGRWDGSYGSAMAQDGIYVWIIQAKDMENDKVYEFKGTVNVLR